MAETLRISERTVHWPPWCCGLVHSDGNSSSTCCHMAYTPATRSPASRLAVPLGRPIPSPPRVPRPFRPKKDFRFCESA